MVQTAMSDLMKVELDSVLGYQKYSRETEGSDNCRNGSSQRTFDTESGAVELNVLRDRKNEFNTALFDAYQRRSHWLEDMVIALYQKGSTTSEICELIEKLCGHHYSKQTVSYVTEATQEWVEHFNQRALKPRYSILYIDATFTKIRRSTVSSEAVYLVLGIDEEGKREILSYCITPQESRSKGSSTRSDGWIEGTGRILSKLFPQSRHPALHGPLYAKHLKARQSSGSFRSGHRSERNLRQSL